MKLPAEIVSPSDLAVPQIKEAVDQIKEEDPAAYLNQTSEPEEGKIPLNDSRCARISEHHLFQNTTLITIVFNAIWIGVDVQANHPVFKEQRGTTHLPLEPYSTIVENLFCTYFTVELVVRFVAFKRKLDFYKDNWFVFDGLLVIFMVIETWVLTLVSLIIGGDSANVLSKFSALRLLRLLRLTRMARLMQHFPELLTLVKGMISATRAVSFILMFLVLCMYVFSIIFTAQLGDPLAPENFYAQRYWESDSDPTGNELFGSLGDSMMSLFTRGMLGDNLAETLQAIKDRGGEIDCPNNNTLSQIKGEQEICERTGGSLMLMWLFVLFMIISAFCLLNMLIGVLCEVIQDSAEQENESSQLSELRHHMAEAFIQIDTSKDGLITVQEWGKMKLEKTVRASMANLGVEEQHMEERLDQMQESLFGALDMDDEDADADLSELEKKEKKSKGLTFEKFIEKVVEIRPDTPASALDIEILRVRVEREAKKYNARLDFIEEALSNGSGLDPSGAVLPALMPPSAKNLNELDLPGPIKPVMASRDDDSQLNRETAWLRDVPTEVLFAILHNRAPPELGPPKLLNQT